MFTDRRPARHTAVDAGMAWWRITAYPDPALVDEVAAVFVQYTGGAAVEDPALVDAVGAARRAPDLVRPRGPAVTGYLAPGLRRRRRLLLAALAGLIPRRRVVTGFCHSSQWDEAWKKYYHAHRVGSRLVVVPAWETYAAPPGETVIRLDPGPAFGNGTHPTTELCLEFLEEVAPKGARVADVGTGSGILAIAAALCGARRVAAVDVDGTALAWAAQNAALNGVAGIVRFYRGAFLAPVRRRTFDLILANLTAVLLTRLAPEAAAALREGGMLVAGGIIAPRALDVREALVRAGLVVKGDRVRDGWVAFLAGRRER